MEESEGCIYLLRCLVGTRKGYVGQCRSMRVQARWRQHICAAAHCTQPLYRALRKYGVENFSAEVVWRGPVSKLNNQEVLFIENFGTFIRAAKGGGYNLTLGGEGASGFKASTKSRQLRSESVRASYKADPSLRLNRIASQLGRVRPAHVLKKVSDGLRAKFAADPNYRRKLSDKRKAYWDTPCEDGLTNAEALNMQCISYIICKGLGVDE